MAEGVTMSPKGVFLELRARSTTTMSTPLSPAINFTASNTDVMGRRRGRFDHASSRAMSATVPSSDFPEAQFKVSGRLPSGSKSFHLILGRRRCPRYRGITRDGSPSRVCARRGVSLPVGKVLGHGLRTVIALKHGVETQPRYDEHLRERGREFGGRIVP